MRRKLSRELRFVVLAGAALALAAALGAWAATPKPSEDERAIRALIDRMTAAWLQADGADTVREALSDRAFAWATVIPSDPPQALLVNRPAFCALFAEALKREPARKHEHTVRHIVIDGPLAVELGEVTHVGPDGKERREEVLNFLAKGADGWKLYFSTPAANVRKAVAAPGY